MDPVVDVPDVRRRLLRVWVRLLVVWGPVLRDHRRCAVAAGELRLPDGIPPPLVALHVGDPLGRSGVGHLRAVVVPDSAMRMVDPRRDGVDDLVQHWVVCVSLRHVDPMAQVGGQLDLLFDLRILQEEVVCRPRRMQEALAVRLVADNVPLLLLPRQAVAEEVVGHGERATVLQRVRNHQRQQPALPPVAEELVGAIHLLLEDCQVGVDHPPLLVRQLLRASARDLAVPQALGQLVQARRLRVPGEGVAPDAGLAGDDRAVGEDQAGHHHVVGLEKALELLRADVEGQLVGHLDAVVALGRKDRDQRLHVMVGRPRQRTI
mmetsp:Transcript_35809/g.94903  ORF Transcript_35809/g.94903 Transcript_35809/m.94903 type:complete len:320 (+) Transcript_35809:166-1125(+)